MIRRPSRSWHKSLNFDASTSIFNYGTLTSEHNVNQPFTFLALIRPTGSGGGGFAYVVAKIAAGTATGLRFIVSHNSGSPQLAFGLDSSSGSAAPNRTTNTGFISYGNWYWVAATCDGTTSGTGLKIYVAPYRGALREATYSATNNGAGSLSSNSGENFVIGNRQGTDRAFAGDIALVCRWNKTLQPEEISKAIRVGPFNVYRNQLVLAWAGGNELAKNLIATSAVYNGVGSNIHYDLRDQSAAIWAAFATVGAQTISPTGIASLEAFGSHTVVPGAVLVTPSGIASAEAFGSHTVAPGTVTVTPSGIATAETFGSHTIVPGAVSVTPSGIATAEAFGSHTVSLGGVAIVCNAIDSAETFGSHSVLPGGVSVICNGIGTAEAFGDAIVSAGGSIVSVTGIASAEAFGSHTILPGAVAIQCTGIASLEAFGATVVAVGAQFVQPTSITSGEAFGTHVLQVGNVVITCTGIATTEAFGSHVILGGAITIYTPGAVWTVREGRLLVVRETRTLRLH